MTDIVDKQTRSRMMAGIRGKDTKPELALRGALHARGLRFRLHAKNVLGRPDLVFPRHRAVVFVHGCFWHRHEGCRYCATPSTRPEFWQAKFEANVTRDSAVRTTLLDEGWRVGTVWECAVRRPLRVEVTADLLAGWLRGSETKTEIGWANPRNDLCKEIVKMVDGPELEDGEYPFTAERLPLSDLAWIEVPAGLEALLRDQAQANGIQLIRGQPVELRCVTPQHGDAVFMIDWPHDVDRLHMLAPKKFQKGRA